MPVMTQDQVPQFAFLFAAVLTLSYPTWQVFRST